MKTLFSLFAAFCLFPLQMIGQNTDCKYIFIDSLNLKKEELYKPIRVWVSKTFYDSKSVIQMDDKELGKIVCKGIIQVDGAKNFLGSSVGKDQVHFTLNIDIKDGKYRLIYDDLVHKAGYYNGAKAGGSLCNDKPYKGGSLEFSKKRWNSVKAYVADQINSLYKELQSDIRTISNDNF